MEARQPNAAAKHVPFLIDIPLPEGLVPPNLPPTMLLAQLQQGATPYSQPQQQAQM